jgi:Flp pilus assembly protein TadD
MARWLNLVAGFAAWAACAQTPDRARASLEKAYQALRAADYETAVAWFAEAVERAPGQARIHKDLAYTYLKTGETEAARDQFGEAARLAPDDLHVALEYAFLCYETGHRALARRIFDRVRRHGDAASRSAAAEAFGNIDRPLEEGIRRWSEAVLASPKNFSAHRELASLAEQRDQPELAAVHYLEAWRLRPAEQSLLLDLARIWEALGRKEPAAAALLQASSSGNPRVAESARELLSPALEGTRLALERGRAALPGSGAVPDFFGRPDAREMADRSYRAGYLNEALRYFKLANEADPADFSVMLQMGWTYNALRQDRRAIRWFAMARQSPDAAVASEADRAYRNLRPSLARLRTTVWLFPFYSSRWNDVFSYGQVKTELNLGSIPLRPYLSARFLGDTRSATAAVFPNYLSESSFLLGAGLATPSWRGLVLWGEGAAALTYLRRTSFLRNKPDFRGGAAYARGFGRPLGGETAGAFLDAGHDAVFIGRFGNDVLFYSRYRAGYTAPPLGGLRAQLCWNLNATVDLQKQYWANFVEFGPGVRLRVAGLPPALTFSADLVRGVHTVNRGNPRRPNFYDLRVGFWYAAAR